MEIKKSPKADLETRKGLYMEIGLVFSLVVIWVAFEWKSYDRIVVDEISRTAIAIEEEMIIQTSQEVAPPPPPPSQVSTEIEVVEDDVEIEDNDVSFDVEADEQTAVEPVEVVMVAEEVVEEEEIFQIVEESPGFPGGEEALHEFIRKNLSYPVAAQESGIQGRVYVGFVVEKDGSVTDVQILRGIGGGCDEAAIRVVKALPKWTPGKQRGRAVRCRYSIPISFTLG